MPTYYEVTCVPREYEIPETCPACNADLRTEEAIIEVALDWSYQTVSREAIVGSEDGWGGLEHDGTPITVGWSCNRCLHDLVAPKVAGVE